jgi:hypothetical protein
MAPRFDQLRRELNADLASHVGAAMEEMRRMFGALDDEYQHLAREAPGPARRRPRRPRTH